MRQAYVTGRINQLSDSAGASVPADSFSPSRSRQMLCHSRACMLQHDKADRASQRSVTGMRNATRAQPRCACSNARCLFFKRNRNTNHKSKCVKTTTRVAYALHLHSFHKTATSQRTTGPHSLRNALFPWLPSSKAPSRKKKPTRHATHTIIVCVARVHVSIRKLGKSKEREKFSLSVSGIANHR